MNPTEEQAQANTGLFSISDLARERFEESDQFRVRSAAGRVGVSTSYSLPEGFYTASQVAKAIKSEYGVDLVPEKMKGLGLGGTYGARIIKVNDRSLVVKTESADMPIRFFYDSDPKEALKSYLSLCDEVISVGENQLLFKAVTKEFLPRISGPETIVYFKKDDCFLSVTYLATYVPSTIIRSREDLVAATSPVERAELSFLSLVFGLYVNNHGVISGEKDTPIMLVDIEGGNKVYKPPAWRSTKISDLARNYLCFGGVEDPIETYIDQWRAIKGRSGSFKARLDTAIASSGVREQTARRFRAQAIRNLTRYPSNLKKVARFLKSLD